MTKKDDEVELKHGNLNEALLWVQEHIKPVIKDEKGQRAKYASESAVREELHPLLFTAKILHCISGELVEVGGTLCYNVFLKFTHVPSGNERVEVYPIILSTRSISEFGSGGALTYGSRYALCKFFGLILEEETGPHRNPDPEHKSNPMPKSQAVNDGERQEFLSKRAVLTKMVKQLGYNQMNFNEKTGYQSIQAMRCLDECQDAIEKLTPWYNQLQATGAPF